MDPPFDSDDVSCAWVAPAVRADGPHVVVKAGLRLLEELARPSSDDVLLATDLHAGNVLRAGREPWLVIDPEPFIGDRAYDATQHLFNCMVRMLSRRISRSAVSPAVWASAPSGCGAGRSRAPRRSRVTRGTTPGSRWRRP